MIPADSKIQFLLKIETPNPCAMFDLCKNNSHVQYVKGKRKKTFFIPVGLSQIHETQKILLAKNRLMEIQVKKSISHLYYWNSNMK